MDLVCSCCPCVHTAVRRQKESEKKKHSSCSANFSFLKFGRKSASCELNGSRRVVFTLRISKYRQHEHASSSQRMIQYIPRHSLDVFTVAQHSARRYQPIRLRVPITTNQIARTNQSDCTYQSIRLHVPTSQIRAYQTIRLHVPTSQIRAYQPIKPTINLALRIGTERSTYLYVSW